MEPATGKIKQYLSDLQDSTAFLGKDATCVLQDKTGTIWAGGFGLNKYLLEKETFIHYTETDGLANNYVMGILEDNSGNLWISTQNGLSKFDPLTKIFENFFSKDGLQGNGFTLASSNLKNGYLMFGGKNGLNIFNPEKIRRNLIQPDISISSFMIFDKETKYKFPQTKVVELKHNHNYFSFEFAALDFSFPSENKYAYKLENFDPEWFYTNASDRKARYTNVPLGEYVFRVKASNNDGVWNETGASVELIIKPPFWKTVWFYFLEGLLFVLVIVAYIKYREKNIKEKGYISIKFSLLDGAILLIVEDNGIGIEASKKMKDKKAKEHKSLAIIITKERMGILNKGKKKKSCSMQIKEIIGDPDSKSGGKVVGTRVEFVIPYLEL